MKSIMIDLETLNTTPASLILSIGAVIFDENGITDRFYIVPNHQQQTDAGRTISIDTLKWWMKQSPEAQAVFTAEQTSVEEVITQLHSFLSKADRGTKMWSNGANFDCVIIDDLFRMYGVENPIKFYNQRCFRTYCEEVGFSYKTNRERSPSHNALEDAVQQAEHLMQIWAKPTRVRTIVENPPSTITVSNNVPGSITTYSVPTFAKIGRRK